MARASQVKAGDVVGGVLLGRRRLLLGNRVGLPT
jgi:hypothetical protein